MIDIRIVDFWQAEAARHRWGMTDYGRGFGSAEQWKAWTGSVSGDKDRSLGTTKAIPSIVFWHAWRRTA